MKKRNKNMMLGEIRKQRNGVRIKAVAAHGCKAGNGSLGVSPCHGCIGCDKLDYEVAGSCDPNVRDDAHDIIFVELDVKKPKKVEANNE